MPNLVPLQDVTNEYGHRIEDIRIDFTDGLRGMRLVVPLKETVLYEGHPITQALEKTSPFL